MKHQPMSHHLAVGDRVDLPQWSSFRTLYPIFECTELLAFVGVETGWGKPWRVYKLLLIDENQKPKPAGVTQLEGCAPLQRDTLIVDLPRGQSGKEAASTAALQMLSLVDIRKEFRTKSELIEHVGKQRGANQRLAADRLASAIKAHANKIEQRSVVNIVLDTWKRGGSIGGDSGSMRAMTALLYDLDATVSTCERSVESARELAKTFEGKQS